MNIDFQQLKQSLTEEQIITIVEDLGGYYKENSMTAQYMIFSSLLYNIGDSENHSYKMYYYYETYMFHDYKLGESFDIFELVIRAKELDDEKYNAYQAAKYICNTLGIEAYEIEDIQQSYNYMKDIGLYLNIGKEQPKAELKTYPKEILEQFPRIYHQSWIDDGISIETMKKYNIRYYTEENEIIIPCYDIDGNLIGIRMRNVDPNINVKYMPFSLMNGRTFKFPTGRVLYGLNHTADNIQRLKKVMIFESEKSVLQCETILKDNNIAVGLYGSSFHEEQRDMLLKLGINEAIICVDFDYDTIGNNKEWGLFQKKVYKIADLLLPYVDKVTALVEYRTHPLKSSPSDLGKKELFRLIKTREEIS